MVDKVPGTTIDELALGEAGSLAGGVWGQKVKDTFAALGNGLLGKRTRFADQGTKTAAYTLSAFDSVNFNTTAGALIATLPSSPVVGDECEAFLAAGTYPLIIKDSAGTTVETITIAGFGVTLRWTGNAWKVGPDRRSKSALDAIYVGKQTTGLQVLTGQLQMPVPLTADMPEYWGAVGDGIADDTIPLKTALGLSASGGGARLSRGKVYGVSSPVAVSDNRMISTIQGGYQGATIKALSTFVIGTEPGVIQLTGTAATLENVAVDAQLAPLGTECIVSTGFSTVVRDVKTTGGRVGFRSASLENNVYHSLFRLASYAGVVNDSYDLLCVDVSTDKCQDGYNSTTGYGSGTLFHFHAIASSRRGFYITGSDRHLLFGCHADTSGQNGFHLENNKMITLSGCFGFNSSSVANGGTAQSYCDYYIANMQRLYMLGCQAGGASYTLADVRTAGTNSDCQIFGFHGYKDVAGSLGMAGISVFGGSGTFAQYNPVAVSSVSTLFASDFTTAADITNSTTETDLYNTTIPANSFKAGSSFRFNVAGRIGNAASAGTLTLKLRYAGATVAQLIFPSSATAASARNFNIDGDIDVVSGGASGEVVFRMTGAHAYGNTTGNQTIMSILNRQTGQVTNTDQTFRVTAQWSVADPANIITKFTAKIQRLAVGA